MKKAIRIAAMLIALAVLAIGCNENGVNSGRESKNLDRLLEVFNKNPGETVYYEVYFNANDATGGEAPSSERAVSGNSIILPDQAGMVRVGYDFAGWNTNGSGTGTGYAAGYPYTVTGTVTLFAKWTPKTYKITYDLDGGTETSPNPTSYTIETPTFKLNDPTRSGYKFAGWVGSTNQTAQTPLSVVQGSTGDKNYVANWIPDSVYLITYNLNDGTVTPANPTSYTKETSSFTLNNPSKEGYTFSGWTGSNGTTAQVTVTVAKGSTGDKSYTANWTIKTYALTTTASPSGSGTFSRSPDKTSYDYGTNVQVTATATTGYTFTGWSGDASGAVNPITITMNNSKAITANFQKNSYTVTVSSIGTGATGGGSYAAGATVSIYAGVAPTGKQFNNWTTTNSGVTFANSTSATTTFTMPSYAVTVTAIWKDVSTSGGNDTNDYVSLGGKKWMKKNLNIQTADSWCYENSTANCDKYGRLYTWSAANSACPLAGSDWRLPTRADWDSLARAVGGTKAYTSESSTDHDWYNAGKYLKSKTGWNSYSGIENLDTYGFSALPGGLRYSGGSFDNAGLDGNWWTATEYGSSDAYYRNMGDYHDGLLDRYYDESYAFSVRCIMNN